MAQMLNPSSLLLNNHDDSIRDYLQKMKDFDKPNKNDITVSRDYKTLKKVVKRLKRMELFIGHGNFQLLSFDEGIYFARKYSQVGEFTGEELTFMEKIFYMDASQCGFYGDKPIGNIIEGIDKKKVSKIPYSGTYLYKDTALELFNNIKKEVGEDLILTSGVRGIMKQFLLFLNKAYKNNGNLSLASRALAPPGYSFHGIGDFDVGEQGLGTDNFTAHFTETTVYSKLIELGYLKLRYPQENLLGVRFEPWHIRIS